MATGRWGAAVVLLVEVELVEAALVEELFVLVLDLLVVVEAPVPPPP
jgi:hypothetical protein